MHHTAGRRQAQAGLEPYGSAALDYLESGLGVPLPLPPRAKDPPPRRTTGRYPDATPDEVLTWAISHRPAGNIALRLAPAVIAVDSDAHKSREARSAWLALTARLGPLPGDAPWISARPGDLDSGIPAADHPRRLPAGVQAARRMRGDRLALVQIRGTAPASVHPAVRGVSAR